VLNLLPFQMDYAGRLRSRLVFINEDRASRDRWAVSVAFALLLHGAIAAAVLNWNNLIISVRLSDPVVMDLLPLPGASGPPQSEPQPAAAVNNGAPSASERVITNAADATSSGTLTPAASERVITNAPDVAPSGTLAPSVPSRNDEQENSAASRPLGGGGGVSHAAPTNGRGSQLDTSLPNTSVMDNSPIDTSIAPGFNSKKAGAGTARHKSTFLLRPSKHSSVGQHLRNLNTAHSAAITTNAVGAHVQDRVRSALARGTIRAAARNAIGVAPTRGIVGGSVNANASHGVAVNAIGMTVPLHPAVTNATGPKTGPIVPTASVGMTTNRSSLNGSAMIVHSSSGTAALGGPQQIRQTSLSSGVLSGNMFHPRHP